MAVHPLLPEPRPADWRALAAAQRGLITFSQLLALGVSEDSICRLLRAGHLVVVHDGVFRVAGVELDWAATALAAVLAPRRRAWLTGMSSLRHQGLRDGIQAPALEVLVEGRALPLLGDTITVHRTVSLPECDKTVVDGIPCVTAARVSVEEARTRSRVELTNLVDRIVGARLAKRSEIHGRAADLRPGRLGCGYLCELTQPGADGLFNSWLERAGANAFRAHGVPEATWNVPIHDRNGTFLRIADAWFAGARIDVELDGPRFHSTPAQLANDRRIDRLAGIDGILVLRYSYTDVVERPRWVASQICAALEARSSLAR